MKKITLLLTMLTLFAFSWLGNAQLTENFDGVFPPTDWVLTAGTSSIDQSTETADHTTGAASFARYDCYNTDGATPAFLTSPRLVVSAADKDFSFWANYYLILGTWGDTAALFVDVSSDGGATWTSGTTNYADNTQFDTWIQTTIDLTLFEGANFSGDNTYVRFKTISDYGSYNIAIDDVVGPAVYVPACANPNPTISNITTTAADATWSAGNGAANYDWEVVPSGNAQGVGIVANGNTANLTTPIAGLTSGTAYDFFIKSDCETAWAGPFTFTTLPDYCAGDHFYDTGGNAGQYSSGENITTVISPDNPGDLVTVTFVSFITESGWDGLMIYDGPDNTAPLLDSGSTFGRTTCPNGAWTGTSTFVPTTFTSTHASGSLTFVFTSDGGVTDAGWDATVTCAPPPSCAAPTALATDTVTNTTANVTWTDGTGCTTAKTVNVTDTATSTAIAGSPFTVNCGVQVLALTGLTGNTNYTVEVVNDCGANPSASTTFNTDCSVFDAPYTEDFEDAGVIDSCWSENGGESWLFNNAGTGHIGNGGTITGSTASGGYFAWIDDSGTNTPSTLTSAMVNLTPLTNPQLSFYELSDNEGDANATLDVEVWDGAAWNNLGTFNTNTNGWLKRNIPLDALTFTGPAQVRFTITDSGSFKDDIAIDDITFEEVPACASPFLMASANITTTSADLDWTIGDVETVWDLEIGVTGFTATGTPTDNDVTKPFTYTIGTSVTTYDVYYRADCGADDTNVSSWVGPFNFTTLPDYCAGDHFYDTGGAGGQYSSGENVTTVISPDNPGDVVTVTFVSFNTENSWDGLMIYDGPDNTAPLLDSGSTYARATCPNGAWTGISTFVPTTFTSTHASGSLTFVFTSDASGTEAGWDATITCALPPVCNVPSAMASANTTQTSVDLTWSAGTDAETMWELVYDIAPYTEPAAGADQTLEPNYLHLGPGATPDTMLAGLTPTSDYKLYYRAHCGGADYSNWVLFDFATLLGNDECVDAIPVVCGDTVTASTVTATDSGGNPAFDVWYSFTGTGAAETVTASLCNSSYDTVIRVFDACAGTEIAFNDDSDACTSGTRSQTEFQSDGIATYYIMIEGFSGNEGTFELNVTCGPPIVPPANDMCANATMLTLGTTVAGEDNTNAFNNTANPTCDPFGDIADMWYSFVAPVSGIVNITTVTGTATKAHISLYSGDCTALVSELCQDNGATGETALTVAVIPGQTYLLQVWNNGGSEEGTFDVTVSNADLLCPGGATTWNGTAWDNGAPTGLDIGTGSMLNAIIDGTYNTAVNGAIWCCTLEVTANGWLEVNDGAATTLTVINNILNSGAILVASGADVLQVNDNAVVIGDAAGFDVEIKTSALPDARYSYLSSPTQTATMNVFSPWAEMSRNFGWDGTAQDWTYASDPTTAMAPGAGYIVRPVSTDTAGTLADNSTGGVFTTNFGGAFNNGVITQPLYFEEAAAVDPADASNALVGNPYPSAISTATLLTDNADLASLYFWAPNGTSGVTGNNGWSTGEYKVWNTTGNVNNPPANIAPGQGFFAVASAAGTLTFNNAMRNTNSSTFLRPENNDLSKIWLNLFSDTNIRSQILIGFNDVCTDGFDARYDAKRFASDNTITFASQGTDANTSNLAIQTRGLLTDVDTVIPLNVSTTDATITSLTISIDHFEVMDGTDIFLQDTVANVTHDLKQGDYTFNISQAGSLDGRFNVVFRRNALSNEDVLLDNTNLLVINQDTHFNVKMANGKTITKLQAFDVLGKLVVEMNPNASDFNVTTDLKTGTVLILKATLESGQVLTKKFVRL